MATMATAATTATAVAVPVLASDQQAPSIALDATTTSPAPKALGSAQLVVTPDNSDRDAAVHHVDTPPRPSGDDARAVTATVEVAAVDVPETGSGLFRVAPAAARTVPAAATTYQVEVERDLDWKPEELAAFIDDTLTDPRGWSRAHQLVRVEQDADLRIVVATPTTADLLCAPLDTDGRLSCRNGRNVVLNAWRWQHGADAYADDITNYRRYLINHETGHALGFAHATCPADGATAPVMLQQTKSLDGCRANPWPGPTDLS